MKFFTTCKTLDEREKEYRHLTTIHHPDHGEDIAPTRGRELKWPGSGWPSPPPGGEN